MFLTIAIPFLKLCMIASLICMSVKKLFKANVFLLFYTTHLVLIPIINKVRLDLK